MAESAKLRPILATIAWHMFLDRPLLGCGFGQYFDEGPRLSRPIARPTCRWKKAGRSFSTTCSWDCSPRRACVGTGPVHLSAACLDSRRLALWQSDEAPLWARQCALLFMGLLGVYFANGMFHNVSVIPMFNMLLFFTAGMVARSMASICPRWRRRRAAARIAEVVDAQKPCAPT